MKTDNVLVSNMFTTKLTDFGESRRLAYDADLTQVGTADFCAPEVVLGEAYGYKVDVCESFEGENGQANVYQDSLTHS